MPIHYDLHVAVAEANPSGLFADVQPGGQLLGQHAAMIRSIEGTPGDLGVRAAPEPATDKVVAARRRCRRGDTDRSSKRLLEQRDSRRESSATFDYRAREVLALFTRALAARPRRTA